jgi:hypothetical protein
MPTAIDTNAPSRNSSDGISKYSTLAAGLLAMWLGALAFYAGVVVEVGADVLGSHTEFGFITRQVAIWLNTIGTAISLILLAGLVINKEQPARRGQWFLWFLIGGSQVTLWILHPWLDALLDPSTRSILDGSGEAFYLRHRIYLWVSAVQWGSGIIYFRMLLVSGKR